MEITLQIPDDMAKDLGDIPAEALRSTLITYIRDGLAKRQVELASASMDNVIKMPVPERRVIHSDNVGPRILDSVDDNDNDLGDLDDFIDLMK